MADKTSQWFGFQTEGDEDTGLSDGHLFTQAERNPSLEVAATHSTQGDSNVSPFYQGDSNSFGIPSEEFMGWNDMSYLTSTNHQIGEAMNAILSAPISPTLDTDSESQSILQASTIVSAKLSYRNPPSFTSSHQRCASTIEVLHDEDSFIINSDSHLSINGKRRASASSAEDVLDNIA
jgi:hypothetical protein